MFFQALPQFFEFRQTEFQPSDFLQPFPPFFRQPYLQAYPQQQILSFPSPVFPAIFILNIASMGHEHGLLEAGFGFGIREHRGDDVLGYLTADDAFDLVEGTFWDKQGIKEKA